MCPDPVGADRKPTLHILSSAAGDLIESDETNLRGLRNPLDKALAGEPQEVKTGGLTLTVRLAPDGAVS